MSGSTTNVMCGPASMADAIEDSSMGRMAECRCGTGAAVSTGLAGAWLHSRGDSVVRSPPGRGYEVGDADPSASWWRGGEGMWLVVTVVVVARRRNGGASEWRCLPRRRVWNGALSHEFAALSGNASRTRRSPTRHDR